MADFSAEVPKKVSKQQRRREKEKKANKCIQDKLEIAKQAEKQHKQQEESIKQQLSEAKEAKDHALAAKLRQDLWVLQDTASGYSPQLSNKEVETSLNRISGNVVGLTGVTEEDKEDNVNVKQKEDKVAVNPLEKELRSLNKKLDQIEVLKEKVAKGETLEKNQIDKIKKEESLRKEIEEVENLMRTMSVTK